MQKIILYLSVALMATCAKVNAQDKTFEQRAKQIAVRIAEIKTEEKKALKDEVEALDKAVELGKMTKEEAATTKAKIAEERAKNIETKIAEQEAVLRDLVNGKMEVAPDSTTSYSLNLNAPISIKSKKNENAGEKRTTSQFVFAAGFNNLVTDGAVANSNFSYGRSSFYEWGYTLNTRLIKNSNLLHLKYGLGFQYNFLHATNNRVFVDVNNQTILTPFHTNVRPNGTYFKNVNFVVPMHLEFDFSKTKSDGDAKIFKSHQAMRVGFGGYVGVNTNSKQYIYYKQDGYKIKERQKGDFNTSDFVYGLSAYIGYEQTSLYVKYDINPMFENNTIDQNNVSLGLRFDFN